MPGPRRRRYRPQRWTAARFTPASAFHIQLGPIPPLSPPALQTGPILYRAPSLARHRGGRNFSRPGRPAFLVATWRTPGGAHRARESLGTESHQEWKLTEGHMGTRKAGRTNKKRMRRDGGRRSQTMGKMEVEGVAKRKTWPNETGLGAKKGEPVAVYNTTSCRMGRGRGGNRSDTYTRARREERKKPARQKPEADAPDGLVRTRQ